MKKYILISALLLSSLAATAGMVTVATTGIAGLIASIEAVSLSAFAVGLALPLP